MRRTRATIATFFFAAALGLSSERGFAQDTSSLAQQRFLRGLTLFDGRNYAQALEEFRGSYQLRASPNSRLYIARTLRELGQLPAAATEFETCVQEAREHASSDARYRATQEAAQQELAAIESRIGRVRVTVVGAPRQFGVRINNATIPSAALTLAIPVEPGTVTVVGEAPGNTPVTVSAAVQPGATEAVQLAFAPDAQQRQDAAGATSLPPPVVVQPRNEPMGIGAWVARGRSPLRYVMFAAAGVGVAAMGVGAGLGASASAAYRGLEMRCGAGPCGASEQGNVDGGRAMQTGANVAFGVGSAALVAGVVLLLVGPRTERAPVESSVAVGLGPDGATVNGVF